MSEIICPVCGKPNTESADACKYCGSILNQSRKASEVPDWLNDLRGSSNDEILNAEPESPAEPPATFDQAPSSFPDYLAGLSQLGEEEDETPDWMIKLQGDSPPLAPAPPAQPPNSPPAVPLAPVNRLYFSKQPAFLTGEETPPEPQPGDDKADSLAGSVGAGPTQAFPPSAGQGVPPVPVDPTQISDLPGWLSSLARVGIQATAPSSTGDASQQNGPNDWLSRLGSDFNMEENPAPSEASVDTGDWGSVPGPNNLNTREPAETVPPFSLDESLSDWSVGPEGSAEVIFSPESDNENHPIPGVSAPEVLPEWMTGLQSPPPLIQESDSAVTGPQTARVAPFDETADWITYIQESSQEPGSAGPGQPLEEMPEWLANLQSPVPAAQAVSQESLETPAAPMDEETSNASINREYAGPAGKPSSDSLDLAAPTSVDSGRYPPQPGAKFEDDLPDWLADLQDSSQAIFLDDSNMQQAPFEAGVSPSGTDALIPPASPTYLPSTPKITEETQANVAGLEAQPLGRSGQGTLPEMEGLIPGQNIDSIFKMDTPDWLSNLQPAEQLATPSGSALPAAENLSAAELPAWVQALRPVESFVVETADSGESRDAENEGPLAGLYSVLPTQPAAVKSPTTQAFSSGLIIGETQQAQAVLLENLIKSEKTAQPTQKRAKINRFNPVRLAITAALLLVVFIVALLGSTTFPSPDAPSDSSPAGVFFKTVAGLPNDAPLLMVMDYQPAFAGEMESALEPVMDQLMSKGTRLAFVSTSPLGGLMADRILQKFSGKYAYQDGQQYVELGYLPGGASGIKSFAEQPVSTLGHDTPQGDLWSTPALKGATVNSLTALSNFSAVVIATDNPDIGRLWIEQAGPALGAKPILMVVSAQAGPMIEPYWASKQVNGLISGMEGGMLYETLTRKPGQARAYWDAFSAALMIAELVILITAAWSLRAGLRARRADLVQDEV